MKCPTCDAWTEVLETRGTRRRRECANGHRFGTEEVVREDYCALKGRQDKLDARVRALLPGTRQEIHAQLPDHGMRTVVEALDRVALVSNPGPYVRGNPRRYAALP